MQSPSSLSSQSAAFNQQTAPKPARIVSAPKSAGAYLSEGACFCFPKTTPPRIFLRISFTRPHTHTGISTAQRRTTKSQLRHILYFFRNVSRQKKQRLNIHDILSLSLSPNPKRCRNRSRYTISRRVIDLCEHEGNAYLQKGSSLLPSIIEPSSQSRDGGFRPNGITTTNLPTSMIYGKPIDAPCPHPTSPLSSSQVSSRTQEQ